MTPENQIGPYQLLGTLGTGGMGEVFKAQDTRLGREVALKMLPKAFASDKDRLERFEQEAQTLASVNHPNLLVLHDTGIHDGQPYLVSELLEGQTLRAELLEGRLPLRKAIDYALQVARGLAAAHGRGVVHRDLKPENIVVTRDGLVKILDFGLAKLSEGTRADPSGNGNTAGASDAVPQRPVMGTVAYMSPELLLGQEGDHRSDIFSFGVVLHEMLSGNSPFRRQETVETMRAVVREEPPDLQSLPPGLDVIVRRCLEKKPELRFQNANDLAFAIETLVPLQRNGATPGYAIGMNPLWWAAAAALVALLVIGGTFLLWDREIPRADVSYWTVAPPDGIVPEQAALSPDGRAALFLAYNSAGKRQLWLRRIGQPQGIALSGTEDATSGFWSPDSRAIGFIAKGVLRVMDLRSQVVREVCQTKAGEGATGSWSARGGILLAGGWKMPIEWIPNVAAGAQPRNATVLDASRQETAHRHPQFLPDGRHFLYVIDSEQARNAGTYVAELGSLEAPRRLLDIKTPVFYAPSGYLIFRKENTIVAQPFDRGTLNVTGPAVPLVQNVPEQSLLSVSHTGMLSYTRRSAYHLQLTWSDRAGHPLKSFPVESKTPYFDFALSPDDRMIAYFQPDPQKGGEDLMLVALADGTPVRLASQPARNSGPVWSPDGTQIVFRSTRSGASDLYRISMDRPESELALVISDDYKHPEQWSVHGLLFSVFNPKGVVDIWRLVLPRQGSPTAEPLLAKAGVFEVNGQISPDGQWIVYASDENNPGTEQVHLRRFPDLTEKQTLPGTGRDPRWSPKGDELFYVDDQGNLRAVPVRVEGHALRLGASQRLFPIRMNGLICQRHFYAVASDGQHFLVSRILDNPEAFQLFVVQNWPALVRPSAPQPAP